MVVWKKVSDTVGEGHLQEQQKEAWNIPPGGWGESLSPQSFAAEGSRGRRPPFPQDDDQANVWLWLSTVRNAC